MTIDCEGVACGPDGVSDYERMRSAVGRKGSRDAFLYVFDLLELDGVDLRLEPWSDRRWRLAKVVLQRHRRNSALRSYRQRRGNAVFRHACVMGLEGIVAKRRDKPYRSGRSPDWIKVKNPDAPAATTVDRGMTPAVPVLA